MHPVHLVASRASRGDRTELTVLLNAELVSRLVRALAVVTLAVIVVRQCRHPRSVLGRLIARNMNVRHWRLTTWGLSHVTVEPSFRILDVGCGGGRTVERLASMATGGRVEGIDYSASSVATARQTNAHGIAAGNVAIRLASVSQLPYPDASFDLVTAVETHYYWPNLIDDLREIRRVLSPNGTLVLIAETYRGRRMDWLYRPVMRLLGATYLTPEEHRDALARAGFADVAVHLQERKGWIAAVGRKPLQLSEERDSTRRRPPRA